MEQVKQMKKIGLIGGMSYESTLDYYTRINQRINRLAGEGLVSADMVLRSVNFDEYYELMQLDEWGEIADNLIFEAGLLSLCDCEVVALCTNTMHKVADQIEEALCLAQGGKNGKKVQFLHIGDCVAAKCREASVERVALIGTRTTMVEGFMRERLRVNGLTVVNEFTNAQISKIDQLIFDELCQGVIRESAEYLSQLCYDLAKSHKVDGIILGCTELGAAFDERFVRDLERTENVLMFDSTQIHIEKIVDSALSE